jgi:hypothetical protein
MNKIYSLRYYTALLGLLASILLFNSCSKEPDELKTYYQSDHDFELFVSKNNVPADNYDFAEISAVTKVRASANDIIEFKADKGVFSNNSTSYSVNVSLNDTTRAFLKYNKSDIVRVTATVYNKFSKEVFVNFLTSFPTQLLVIPDTSTLQPLFTSKCYVKSILTRQVGSVSEGLLVNYYDSIATSVGGSIGSFHNLTYSNAQGESTVEYSLQDTAYHGFVYIKSFIDTDAGRVVGVNRIYIQ